MLFLVGSPAGDLKKFAENIASPSYHRQVCVGRITGEQGSIMSIAVLNMRKQVNHTRRKRKLIGGFFVHKNPPSL